VRIHFLVNLDRLDAVNAAIEAIEFVKSRGVECGTEVDSAERLGIPGLTRDEIGQANLMVCFGGDGTLIRAAEVCALHNTPILGVYFGRFGFVTQCDPSELGASLSEFFDGSTQFETRMMLQINLERSGETVATFHALNEMALQRAVNTSMLTFSVEVDNHYITSYPADGVLVATPTGSTAYNLSAGGPILDPRIEAIILNALAPHTLSARPLLLSADSTVQIKIHSNGDAMLSVDGQKHLHLLSGDRVRITRSPRVTTLVQVDSGDFLEKLGQRLFWSFSIMGSTA
jgi:NAD+ kinase